LGLGLIPLAAIQVFAAGRTITINTVQIFGAVDPANISDHMASANL
jgi:hypothetical protein